MLSADETIAILESLRDNKKLITEIRHSWLSRPYDSERDLFETGFREAIYRAILLIGLKAEDERFGPDLDEFDSLIEDFQSKTFNDDGIEDLAQIIPILKSDNLDHRRRFDQLEKMVLDLKEQLDRLTVGNTRVNR